MQILGREVDVAYSAQSNALLVNLHLSDDDCPERKNKYGVALCDGDCKGSYLQVILKDGIVDMIGGVTKDCFCAHVNEEICSQKGYGATPEQHAALCKKIVTLYKSEVEKRIPNASRAMFEHFLEQLDREKSLPGCAVDLDSKTISFDETKSLRSIDIYMNNEKLMQIIHSCSYLVHPTIATIRAKEIDAIRNNLEELKRIAVHPHALVSTEIRAER